MLKKAVFLDRDGTIIVNEHYLNDPKKVQFLPGVFQALQILKDDGFVFLVATNQSGVPRGIVDRDNLDQIHEVIRSEFARKGIDFLSFYDAPYMPETNHPMRKPNCGMLTQGARDHQIDLRQSWMIGDRMTDVEAGHRAGSQTILLSNQILSQIDMEGFEPPTLIVPDLLGAAQFIVSNQPS